MPQIHHHLAAHDALTLTVVVSVADAQHGLKHVRIVDRFGLALHDGASAKQAEDIFLRRVPRPRFPIRVEAKNADGEKVVSDYLYVSPTDAEFRGVALPRAAIDIDNDTEIRQLRTAVLRGNARAVGLRRRYDQLAAEQSELVARQHSLWPAMILCVAGAAMLATTETIPGLAVVPGLAALVFGLIAARLGMRSATVRTRLAALDVERDEVLGPSHEAGRRLIELGLGDLISSLGCGCHKDSE
jgi:hypothetical protein